MKKTSTDSRLVRYGVEEPKGFDGLFSHPVLTELYFFREAHRIPEGYDGPGAYQHAVNAANMLWRRPGEEMFKWHPDLETALAAYCEVNDRGETLVTGPASGGKTFGAALYAMLSMLCDPLNTGILCCSTTLDGLKRRLWGDVRKLYQSIAKFPEFATINLVDSTTSLQTEKGGQKHGIFGLAVAQGNETKAVGRIIGFHPQRLIVIVDELTDVSWAIVAACTNLFTGKKKAHFIGIGNATSIFDSHGKMCEPKTGWNSVSVESDRWETQRGGTCIHFDGFKSPNVVSGRVIYDFLLTSKDIAETAKNDGENSPAMWRMRRGFWCPEGTVATVLSEPLINNFMCMSKDNTWESTFTMYAGLDPAFEGGDRCILRFGKVGKNSQGKPVVELSDIITIKPDAAKFQQRPLEYQIADKVKSECESRTVQIGNFAMDITGAGAGLAAIISEEWMHGLHKTHFASKPSELPAGPTDLRPCSEVYFDKVTELWYSIRMAVMAFQIKGLDAETAIELCNRRYDARSKIILESKKDMKKRPGARSPDVSDALAVLLDVIKTRGALPDERGKARKQIDNDWNRLVREFTLDDEGAYTEDSVLSA